MTSIGYWNFYNNNNSHFYEIYDKRWKYIRRSNFQGILLKTAVVVTQNISQHFLDYLESDKDRHLDSMHKYNFALLKIIQQMFNFKLNVSCTSSWGYLNNNVFDGMVGMLQRREIDIGGSPLFFMRERLRAMDYTIESWDARSCFIFRRPKNTEALRVVFLYPLADSVWFVIIIYFILVLILLRIIIFLTCSYNFKCTEKDSVDTSWSFLLIVITGIFSQQGLSETFNTSSFRIITFSSILCSFFLYQFYSGSIVSSLINESKMKINSLSELLNSHLQLGAEDILYTRNFFNKTTETDTLEIYKKIKFLDPLSGVIKVKQGGYAFHVDTTTGYKIIQQTFPEEFICELAEIDMIPFPTEHMVANVQKGSPFRKIVTYGLRRLCDTGVKSRMVSFYKNKKPECVQKGQSINTPSKIASVKIEDLSFSFLFLGVGIIFSLFFLNGEIIWNRKK